jgi:hypothetical protein
MRAFLLTTTRFPIPGRVKEPVFLVSEGASSMGVARTVDAVMWGKLDSFQEPEQRYEDLLELGRS